jgi:uncharacterized protein
MVNGCRCVIPPLAARSWMTRLFDHPQVPSLIRRFGIFAKEPIPGRVKTRLAAEIGPVAAAEFADLSLRELCLRCADIGAERVIGFSPNTPAARAYFSTVAGDRFTLWPQPEGTLGHRMEAFLATGRSAHPETSCVQSVLIGSDSPDLPLALITAAFQRLQDCDVVLGPTTDGGYYLIGTRITIDDWLHAVPWSSEQTLAATQHAITQHGATCQLLSAWYDIDTLADVQRLAAHCATVRRQNPTTSRSPLEAWCHKVTTTT